jgi:hypothetical protein
MRKEVQLIKKSNGKLCLIPIDEFFERDIYSKTDPIICNAITQIPFGWWIHMKTYKGGGFDGIGDDVRVEDFTDTHADDILKNNGKCYVEVDYNNKLSCPTNGRGDGKIVIFLTRDDLDISDCKLSQLKRKRENGTEG